MDADKTRMLTECRALLRYHALLGIDGYPQRGPLKAFWGSPPQGTPSGKGGEQHVTPVLRRQSGSTVPPPPRRQSDSPLKLTDIAGEVAECRACTLHQQRLYPVAGRGCEGVRLLIVGDWLAADARTGALPAGHLFGVEQDELLAKMLAAIALSPEEVYITNAIKCAVPADCQPQAEHLQTCLGFLRREIAVVAPQLICTMGMVATRVLLEQSAPLSSLRGRFHELPQAGQLPVAVLATYHPTFLLNNPEMKRAAWADLQLLAKRLGLTPGR